jgi:hypothetical protein
MRPPRLPPAVGSIAPKIGLTVGGGGAGSLAALALVHKPGTTAIAAAGVGVAFAANAAESASRSLPTIIDAISNLLTARIRARADAKATIILVTVRAELARAGLDPGKSIQAAEMQRALGMNPDLPGDRRPSDEAFIKLYGAARARNITSESGTSPDSPGSGSRNPKAAASNLVPIRSDT